MQVWEQVLAHRHERLAGCYPELAWCGLPGIAVRAFSDVIGTWAGLYLGNSPITLGEKEL